MRYRKTEPKILLLVLLCTLDMMHLLATETEVSVCRDKFVIAKQSVNNMKKSNNIITLFVINGYFHDKIQKHLEVDVKLPVRPETVALVSICVTYLHTYLSLKVFS